MSRSLHKGHRKGTGQACNSIYGTEREWLPTQELVRTPRSAALAEADGNRTRQGACHPLNGFEDRGTHQAS